MLTQKTEHTVASDTAFSLGMPCQWIVPLDGFPLLEALFFCLSVLDRPESEISAVSAGSDPLDRASLKDWISSLVSEDFPSCWDCNDAVSTLDLDLGALFSP